MIDTHNLRIWVIVFAIGWAIPSTHGASGDVAGGRDASSVAPRGESAIKGFSEIIESAGELMLDLVKPTRDQSSPEAPKWNSLESPRHTVMTFIEAMEHIRRGHETAWTRAVQTLGATNEMDVDLRQRAIALQEIFDRIGPVRAIDLPGAKQMGENDASRFEVFPYGLRHEWIWRQLGQAPEGKVVLVLEPSTRSWIFSAATVEGAPALYESMRSIAPNYDVQQSGQTFLDVFGPTFRRTPWWGWVALFGAIVVGIFGGRLFTRGVVRVAQFLEDRDWELGGGMIRTIGGPGSLFLFAVSFTFGLMFIRFTPTLSALRWNIIEMLLLVALGWLLFELIDLIAVGLRKMFRKKTEYTDMAVTLIRRSLRVFIIVIFVIFVLQNVLGLNITALITGLGIVGLAISLAGKDSARNLFGALTVFMNRPFVVGDWIRFRQSLGVVEDVGMQSTRMRLASGEVLVVPNMQFIDHEVENLSLRKFLRREMNLAITYGTKPEKVEEAIALLKEILKSDEIVQDGRFDLEKHPPHVSFSRYDEYALNLKVYYWYYMHEDHRTVQRNADGGWYTFLDHCSAVNGAIQRAFGEAGIEFAFPTRTVHWASADAKGFAPSDSDNHEDTPKKGKSNSEAKDKGSSKN